MELVESFLRWGMMRAGQMYVPIAARNERMEMLRSAMEHDFMRARWRCCKSLIAAIAAKRGGTAERCCNVSIGQTRRLRFFHNMASHSVR
jgi:hypothetical protein